MEKRSLKELNVLDDFLFQELITRGKKGEEFCQLLLGTILGKEIGHVKVIPQKNIPGISPGKHGIKIDAYVETDSFTSEESARIAEIEMQTDIYDIEPNKYKTKNEAKRTRYYHSLIDAKILRSGVDYEKLRNVVIIMILPYDPFGKNRMVYTFENHCKEDDTIECSDGNRTIYLYTRGTEGNPSKEMIDMLKYIEESRLENANNEALQKIHKFVEEVRHDEEVGVSYMKSFELERMYREEGMQIGIQAMILENMEENVSKERTLEKLQKYFPITASEAKEYYEEIVK